MTALTIAQDLILHHTQDEIDGYIHNRYETTNLNGYGRVVGGAMLEYTFDDGSTLWWSDTTGRWYATERQAYRATFD